MAMKRMILFLLAAAVTLTLLMPAAAEGIFPDVSKSQWYYTAVMRLYGDGVIDGFDDGRFYPDSILTAAQFIKMLYYDTTLEAPEGEKWWYKYYLAGVDAGVLNDATITEDEMDYPIDRYETSNIISAMGIEEHSGLSVDIDALCTAIGDLETIPYMFADAVVKVYASGIIQGFDDGCFHGSRFLTRAQAAQIVLKLRYPEYRTPIYLENAPGANEDNDWTDDALLIGNSLAGGLCLYGSLDGLDFLYMNGLTVFSAISEGLYDREGNRCTIEHVLSQRSYGKIILLFGTNELGYDTELFRERYYELILKIKEYQPDAEIFLHNVPPLNEEKNGHSKVFTNKNAENANSMISELAGSINARVIDVHSLLADSSGALPSKVTPDGIHLNALWYVKWAQFLYSTIQSIA